MYSAGRKKNKKTPYWTAEDGDDLMILHNSAPPLSLRRHCFLAGIHMAPQQRRYIIYIVLYYYSLIICRRILSCTQELVKGKRQ